MTVQPMKMALICAHCCPVGNLGAKDTGGMNVYVRELASHLGSQGHLVDIYTRVHDPNDDQVVEISDNARLIHLQAGDFEDIHKLMVRTSSATWRTSAGNTTCVTTWSSATTGSQAGQASCCNVGGMSRT